MMLTLELPACFNCLRFLNRRTLMQQVGEHTFHCATCGQTKELVLYPKIRQRIVFLPESLVLLALSLGWTALKAAEPLILMMPLSALISPFVALGYLYIALRILFRGKKA